MSLKRIFEIAKPWLVYAALFLFIRYTGIISAVSSATQKALMHTGVMDAEPEIPEGQKKFNYNFTLKDINQKSLDIQSLKGKTIFINVWATWCGPCRVEMPSIQRLYENVDHDKIVFIMLALDQKDPLRKVTNYIAENKYTFPVYFPSGQLPEQLQVSTIPSTFVVNKEGKIVFREMGAANYGTEEFQKFLTGI
jgi:thiol-disulfide isomerase/thioredoxin